MKVLRLFFLIALLVWGINSIGQTCNDVTVCWPYTVTGDNHTIIILTTSNPRINGNSLPSGSYIGVFYDEGSGVFKCGGYQQWNGVNTSLAAFGNDESSINPPNGFASNEVFKFRYLLPSGEIVDNVTATFEPIPGTSGFVTHTNAFGVNGLSVVTSMQGTGSVTTATISGAILTETGTAIPGVKVKLTGSATDSMTTTSNGLYSFTVTQGGNYTITPSKSNDVTTNNGITSVDISLIRRHVLGILPLLNSPYKIIAADASNSGTVSTGDIPPVRIVVLNNTAKFPPSNSRLWEFVSSYNTASNPFPFVKTRTYNNLTSNQINQNFTGVKIGDVNNTWNSLTP